jgi:hypothetical protein
MPSKIAVAHNTRRRATIVPSRNKTNEYKGTKEFEYIHVNFKLA